MIASRTPVRSKMSTHYRKIMGRHVYVKTIGPYEYEVTVDNSFPTVVQLNRPATLLNLVEDITNSYSRQLNLPL